MFTGSVEIQAPPKVGAYEGPLQTDVCQSNKNTIKFQNVLSITFYLVNLRGVGLRFPPLLIMITNGGQRRTIPLKLTKQKVMFLQIFSVL